MPQQAIDAGQFFIGMGFSVEETNRTLRATGDALAALNLPADTTHRLFLALGQIRAKGRLTGEEIRQLANANIPIYEILSETLGKNVTQLNRIGDARIPASVAIDAIVSGMESRFGGASKEIAQTTSGQMERLRGDLQAIFGGLTKDLYDNFGGALRRITPITEQMFGWCLPVMAGYSPLLMLLISPLVALTI